MMVEQLVVMIMAGGSGTRFWPISRRSCPKQFLCLGGPKSMLRLTAERFLREIPGRALWVLTNQAYQERTRQLLPEVPPQNIIAEPLRRDTAAAVALGCALVERVAPQAYVLFLPADHIIKAAARLLADIQEAITFLQHESALLTFGIAPTAPLTRFGYIKRGERYQDCSSRIYQVAQFTEKPPLATAQRYLQEGGYYWNSGMFLWQVPTIMQALQTHLPQHCEAARSMARAWQTPEQEEVWQREFTRLPAISIDYGLMEKAREVAVLEASFDWDDVGGWDALARLYPADEEGNVIQARHVGQQTSGCTIYSNTQMLVTTLGVQDLIIVASEDALLVAHRDSLDQLKELINTIAVQEMAAFL